MSRLSRVVQTLFGSTAGINQVTKFGSFAAGSTDYITSASDVQGANFLDGWFSAVLADNAPCMEDMNAIFLLAFYQLAYVFQAGIPEWDATTTYYTGSLVQDGTGIVYCSITNGNINHALTSATNWKVVSGNPLNQQTANYTLTPTDRFVEMDATAGVRTITLPAASTMSRQVVTITKTDSTPNPVNVGSFTALIAQYDSITIFSNGTVWYPI